MRGILARLLRRECEHEHTLVVTSVGVRRTICEDCGHISFKMLDIPGQSFVHTVEVEADLPHAEGL